MVMQYIIDKRDIRQLLLGEELPLEKTYGRDPPKAFCLKIVESLSNGEMFMAMFPNIAVEFTNTDEYTNKPKTVVVFLVGKVLTTFSYEWWNAPFKEK